MTALGAAAAAAATATAPRQARAEARAEARVEPVGPPDGAALRGTVLVWQDAPLLSEPAEAAVATAVRVAAFDAPRRERLGHVIPMRVVAARGAFVEVDPIGEPDCTWSRLTISDDIGKLRLFVRRADLAPVLVKPFAKAFPDGTRLALAPGMPVLATSDGGYAISLRGSELRAEIPAASVGYAYTPERAKPAPISGQEFTIDPKAALSLGGQPLANAGWRAPGIERHGELTLYAIEERCVSAQAAAPSKAVREAGEDEASLGLGGSGGGGGVLGLRGEHYLPITTPLSAGGRAIAMAVKPIYLPAAPRGKTVCVDRRLWLDAAIAPPSAPPADLDDKLRLCAPATRVAHEKLRGSGSANGTTRR